MSVRQDTGSASDVSDGEPSVKRAKIGGETVKLAYLGPEGTYGHQAAQLFAQRLGAEADFIPCPNIAAVYGHPATLLCLPFQNTIYGQVDETIDCLLSPLSYSGISASNVELADAGSNVPQMSLGLSLPIQHCLVVKKGVSLKDIKWIRSHEQAIGQCSRYLEKYVPHATREKWPSTAGAAMSLLDPSEDDVSRGPGAAICSKAAVRGQEELVILAEGIQTVSNNFTRFVLLDRHEDGKAQSVRSDLSDASTSDRGAPPRGFWAIPHIDALADISSQSKICGVYPRPRPTNLARTPEDGPWPMWYLVESHADPAGTMNHEVQRRHEAVWLGCILAERIQG